MFTSPAPPATTTLSAGVLSFAAASGNHHSHLHPAASPSHPHSQHSSSADASTSSISRTRRGLSYLRNYTHTHLLARDHNNTSPNPTSPKSPNSTSFFRTPQSLTRSTSDTPSSSSSTPRAVTAVTRNGSARDRNVFRPTDSRRFTLVPSSAPSFNPFSSSPPDDDESDDQGPPLSTIQSTPLTQPPPQQHQPPPPPLPSPGHVTTPNSDEEREQDLPTSRQTASSEGEQESSGRPSMTRSRSATTGTVMATSTATSTTPRPAEDGSSLTGILPSIRFSVFVDPRSTRPSLHFSPIARTLPSGQEIIRVGRYSERDSQPAVPNNVPSSAPVGFKSKVVSRRHCEFWYEEGKWYIKDVKSSSGTFLNHIRLSPPGQESKPYAVNDGDVVQLGIDFKGGEEMIFRCVKMRLELNRGWQNKLNKFNMSSHKRLWNMTKSEGTGKDYSQDCSICLNSIAPCQCLFVAPCSHTWHYKCIRALLSGPNYPIFICPNCRAAADLEAEVEDPEDWEELNGEMDKDAASTDETKSKEPRLDPPAQVEAGRASIDRIRTSLERARASAAERARSSMERSRPSTNPPSTPAQDETPGDSASASSDNVVMADAAGSDRGSSTPPSLAENSHATATPMPIPATTPNMRRTPSPGSGGITATNGHEGPITPRNDAGPWVFDGSGARIGAAPMAGARQSLNGVVDGMDTEE